MNFLYLALSILGESGGYIFDRLNFKQNKISFRHLMFLGFLGMLITLWLFIFMTNQLMPDFSRVSISLMALIIAFSFGGNIFDELSLKADDLSLREPIVDFYPILAGLVAYVFFPEERNPLILLAFIAGTLITRWGIHRIKLRRLQKKGISYLLLATVLYAILPSLYKEALQYISPAYISAFRVTGIFFLISVFLPPKSLHGFTTKRIWYSIFSSTSCSIAAIASLYAIQSFGVVLTMLFMMLGPALRYLASQFILHEKLRKTEVISSLMLTLVVAVTAFFK
jgi:hypothetical protein